ncbi:MAG: chemotaxis protein CheA [bacterium]|nr:MAG: chemotaxis protein CheA [bacterium]
MNKNIEKKLFDNFLSESADLLRELESGVIALEKSPDNRENVDNIFRCVHSLKGGSALFGLAGIKLFTHTLENLIDKIRNRKLEADTKVINVILKGADCLKAMFARLVEDGGKADLVLEEERFVEEISLLLETSQQPCETVEERLHGELMRFVNRLDIKKELEDNEPLKEIVTIIKDNSPRLLQERRAPREEQLFYRGMDVSREYFTIKSVTDEAERQQYSENNGEMVFSSIDSLIKKHEEKNHKEPLELLINLKEELELVFHDETGFDEILVGITSDYLEKYGRLLEKGMPENVKSASDENEKAQKSSQTLHAKQVKVDQSKLDETISVAGELVTISEFFNYLQTQFSNGNAQDTYNSLRDAITTLQGLSEVLSRDLYEIRKVPVNEAMQKLPRLVRDEEVRAGKKVRLVMTGEKTLVDKSLVPKLETIFVHMIRNGVDHGIEHPQKRREEGKPEEGTISLFVKADESKMIIKISDDGQGIDLEKIKQKGLATGIIGRDELQSLSESEIVDKIFMPGFSTSEKVTETSGRGVGMDIVRSHLLEMDGAIAVDNDPRKGIGITLTIPLTHTTLVKKGLAVAVGKSVFLIPIETVLESFQPSNGEISSVKGKGEIINRRGEITMMIRLHRLFGINTDVTDPAKAILVLVQHKNTRVCFMVDYVLGQRQIIYKKLTLKTLRQPPPFEGVSVYDGSQLAMILDVNGIIKQIGR